MIIRLVRYLSRQPKPYVFALALVLVAVLGGVDYLTGSEWAFSLFYLAPIALAAWLVGTRAGISLSVASAISWLLADVSQRTYSHPAIPLWNTGIRLGFFVIVTLILNELQRARAREQDLRNQEEALRQFIVHDLRNYLGSIQAGLQLMGMEPAPETGGDRAEVVQLALTGCHRMMTLVNALLDTARLESGQMPLNLDAVDLHELLDVALQQVDLWAQQRRLALEQDIPPGLGQARADSALIQRVLVNLLGNAIKFSPPGTAIRVSAAPAAQQQLVVRVTDRGKGIPPEWIDRVFDRYAQVEARKALGTVGSGLGLAFCKLAVEAHGGRIWLESQLGQGTTVNFTLPAA